MEHRPSSHLSTQTAVDIFFTLNSRVPAESLRLPELRNTCAGQLWTRQTQSGPMILRKTRRLGTGELASFDRSPRSATAEFVPRKETVALCLRSTGRL